MNNKILLHNEFTRSTAGVTRVTTLCVLTASVAYLLLNHFALGQAAALRKVAILIPFLACFVSLQKIKKSYILHIMLIRDFERKELFTGALLSVRRIFILLPILFLMLNLPLIWTEGTSVFIVSFSSQAIIGGMDLALFTAITSACFITVNDMATYILPLIPFLAVLTPLPLRTFIRLGYCSPQLPTELTSFSSVLTHSGGIVYLIENILCIFALVILTRKVFCSKDF